jgi:hypothetical protein
MENIQLLQKLRALSFMATDCLLQCSQDTATVPCPQPNGYGPKCASTGCDRTLADLTVGTLRSYTSGVPRFFFSGGQQIQLRTEGGGNGDLGGGSPLVRCSAQFAIRFDFVKLSGCCYGCSGGLLRMYFPRNWEFGSALSKVRNFGGGGDLNPPSVRH